MDDPVHYRERSLDNSEPFPGDAADAAKRRRLEQLDIRAAVTAYIYPDK